MLDDYEQRNRLIEQEFPDGTVESGFNYIFEKLDEPLPLVSMEIRMSNGETLRLFFAYKHFIEFSMAASTIAREVHWRHGP